MNAQVKVDVSTSRKLILGGGLTVSVQKVEVSSIHQAIACKLCTSSSDKNNNDNLYIDRSLDILFDATLLCGDRYEIDATMVYSATVDDNEEDGLAGMINTIKDAKFLYSFHSDLISNDMTGNICAYVNDSAIEKIMHDMKHHKFTSVEESQTGKNCMIFEEPTASSAYFHLATELNLGDKGGFDSNLLAELDKRIREGAISALSKPKK